MIFKEFGDMTLSEAEIAFTISTESRTHGFPDESSGIMFLLITNQYLPKMVDPFKTVQSKMGMVKQDIMKCTHTNNRKQIEDAIAKLTDYGCIFTHRERVGSFNYTVYSPSDSWSTNMPGTLPYVYDDLKLHVSLYAEFSMAGFNSVEKDIVLLLFIKQYSNSDKYIGELTKEWIAEKTGLSNMQASFALKNLVDKKILKAMNCKSCDFASHCIKENKIYCLSSDWFELFEKKASIFKVKNIPLEQYQYTGPCARIWMTKRSIGLENKIEHIVRPHSSSSYVLESHNKQCPY